MSFNAIINQLSLVERPAVQTLSACHQSAALLLGAQLRTGLMMDSFSTGQRHDNRFAPHEGENKWPSVLALSFYSLNTCLCSLILLLLPEAKNRYFGVKIVTDAWWRGWMVRLTIAQTSRTWTIVIAMSEWVEYKTVIIINITPPPIKMLKMSPQKVAI